MKSFLHYDIKILMALLQSLKGDKKFFKYLLNNGYPELAAWSNVVRGDEQALHWLLAVYSYHKKSRDRRISTAPVSFSLL